MLIDNLSPSQEHFFKKYLLKNRLVHELLLFSDPDCCDKFGTPFKSKDGSAEQGEFPLLQFFFKNFVTTFPFISCNSEEEQVSVWQDTVQPFIENLNLKGISNSDARKDKVTKRRQVNTKFLLGLLLFYNSMIISKQELTYLQQNKLKPAVSGMDKITSPTTNNATEVSSSVAGKQIEYSNNYSLNIVAVRRVEPNEDAAAATALATSSSSYWKPFKIFSDPVKPKHHYEFIIEVTKRGDSGTVTKHYINRAYHEFHKLENALKRAYPGLMSTEVSKLPKKLKHDSGVPAELGTGHGGGSDIKLTISNTSYASNTSSISSTSILYREKLRLSLRGYLKSLLKHPEIVLLDSFQKFVNEPLRKFTELGEGDVNDMKQRVDHESLVLKTQLEFQQQTSKLIMSLSKDFDGFKKKLVMDPGALTEIFHEIGNSQSIDELSPLMKTFFEWSKLEIAATLYQVFLSQDNSGEWLLKCKKFHKLFPYGIVYGILRFTNPMKVVSKVIDLLLVNIPSVSLWPLSSENTPSYSRNLLSMIFVMLLDEDLNDFEKELKILEEEKLQPATKYSNFLERLKSYATLDSDLKEEIKNESSLKEQSIVYTILSTKLTKPLLTACDKETLIEIKKSEREYNKFISKGTHIPDSPEHSSSSSSASSTNSFATASADVSLSDVKLVDTLDDSCFYHLQQYWQIQVRKQDKDLMKQLWQEPELTSLIKKFLTIFYQPLMKVFSKSDIHIIFRDFQYFMDDLIITLGKLSDGEVFLKSSFEIFEILKSVLDRHDVVFWRFLHNLYNKDDDQLFIGLIKWIERFLTVLRYKFSDPDSVTIDLERITLFIDDRVDKELFERQLNALTNQTIQKRKLFKEYLEKKAEDGNSNVVPGSQKEIDKNWENMNDKIWGDEAVDLGLNNEDLQDFNLEEIAANGSEEDLSKNGGINVDRELQMKLQELNNEQAKVGTSELDKFDDILKSELVDLFKKLDSIEVVNEK